MIKVFNSTCTSRLGVGEWYRPVSVFSISFFCVCSMNMVLCDFSLKPYCTYFGKIWWYLVWTQGYWHWLNNHFKNKCNFWSNPIKWKSLYFYFSEWMQVANFASTFVAIIQIQCPINSFEVTSQPETTTS